MLGCPVAERKGYFATGLLVTQQPFGRVGEVRREWWRQTNLHASE